MFSFIYCMWAEWEVQIYNTLPFGFLGSHARIFLTDLALEVDFIQALALINTQL